MRTLVAIVCVSSIPLVGCATTSRFKGSSDDYLAISTTFHGPMLLGEFSSKEDCEVDRERSDPMFQAQRCIKRSELETIFERNEIIMLKSRKHYGEVEAGPRTEARD